MADDIVTLLRMPHFDGEVNKLELEAADEIERLRELLRQFWKESQCIECWEVDSGTGIEDWLNEAHNSEMCEVAKVQSQYIEMFRDDEYMMAEDDD